MGYTVQFAKYSGQDRWLRPELDAAIPRVRPSHLDEFTARRLWEQGTETLRSCPVSMHHQNPLGLSHFFLPETEPMTRDVLSLSMFPELADGVVDIACSALKERLGAHHLAAW